MLPTAVMQVLLWRIGSIWGTDFLALLWICLCWVGSWMLTLTVSIAATLNVVIVKGEVCTTLALIFPLYSNHSAHSVTLGGFIDPVWNHLECTLCIKCFFLCDLLIHTEEANLLNYGYQHCFHLNLTCFEDKQVKAGHFLTTSSLVVFYYEIY